MKFANIMLNTKISEEEEEEGDVDLSALFGSQETSIWFPGIPAFYGPDNRAVLIAGEINEQVANAVIAQMQQLHANAPEEAIRVYVNTIGGDAASAFALYDWMRCLNTPIVGIAYGRCSSAGLPILMGADLRLSTPRCRFFYHEVIAGYIANSVAEVEEAAKNYTWHQETMKEILTKRAKINKTKWKKHFSGKTSFYFNSEFALEMGIIHDRIEEINKKIKLVKEQ